MRKRVTRFFPLPPKGEIMRRLIIRQRGLYVLMEVFVLLVTINSATFAINHRRQIRRCEIMRLDPRERRILIGIQEETYIASSVIKGRAAKLDSRSFLASPSLTAIERVSSPRIPARGNRTSTDNLRALGRSIILRISRCRWRVRVSPDRPRWTER